MNRAQGQSSIWSAALVAARCTETRPGRTRPVQWRNSRDHVRYRATHEVVVQPFGIHLAAGEVLEVRWKANDTAYDLRVIRESL